MTGDAISRSDEKRFIGEIISSWSTVEAGVFSLLKFTHNSSQTELKAILKKSNRLDILDYFERDYADHPNRNSILEVTREMRRIYIEWVYERNALAHGIRIDPDGLPIYWNPERDQGIRVSDLPEAAKRANYLGNLVAHLMARVFELDMPTILQRPPEPDPPARFNLEPISSDRAKASLNGALSQLQTESNSKH